MHPSPPSTPRLFATAACVCLVALVATLLLHRQWPASLRARAIQSLGGMPAEGGARSGKAPAADDHAGHDHAGHDHGHDHDHATDGHDHDHDHEGHEEENSLELSEQARRSIGLEEGEVALSTFVRTITLPGMVVERRGRSKFTVIAPMTGAVARILVTEGEAVVPGQALFELRLTHEEIVQAQADLLRTTAEVDVVSREIARLEGIGPEGLIPIKTILDRKYELQKLEAVQLAQRQSLLLHGLSEEQVTGIVEGRTLLGSVVVRAPAAAALEQAETTLTVQALAVERGQHVMAGDTLAVLVDHASLLVEGQAFEQDLAPITAAAAEGKPIAAVPDEPGAGPIEGLKIAYVADRVDPESRTLHFYVGLPNVQAGAPRVEGEHRFVTWRSKPGQRMQLRVPVEEWTERIVLPATAVAQEGVENWVFRSNGDHFDREPVHVEYRDPRQVVIANDGTLLPGDRVAISAAQQLHLALKNKSGGGIDPHAGHDH